MAREDLWREGKYLDMWSLVHALSGVVIALFPPLFPYGISAIAGGVLAGNIAWEFFERRTLGVKEYKTNGVADVLLGLLAALLVFPFSSSLSSDQGWTIFLFVMVAYGSLVFVGWRAYRRRANSKL